jgi:hypothetical protein
MKNCGSYRKEENCQVILKAAARFHFMKLRATMESLSEMKGVRRPLDPLVMGVKKIERWKKKDGAILYSRKEYRTNRLTRNCLSRVSICIPLL